MCSCSLQALPDGEDFRDGVSFRKREIEDKIILINKELRNEQDVNFISELKEGNIQNEYDNE